MTTFQETLSRHGLRLVRGRTVNLQVNLGLRCNQTCRHCRLRAGADRSEVMTRETLEQVITYASRCRFEAIDLTGGAPELHPDLGDCVRRLFPLARTLRLRTNLTALLERREELMPLLREHRVALAASFPSLEEEVAEAQRGHGTFRAAIECLRRLNAAGYGREGSGLQLDLVTNPAGNFLPEPQERQETEFRRTLRLTWGIEFNRLYTFVNLPLGRFRTHLEETGAYDGYRDLLAASFNSRSVSGLMCRDTVSVDWEGILYDCDFNLPTGLYLGGEKRHVSTMAGPPEPGSPIAVGDHCFACTAGTGFT